MFGKEIEIPEEWETKEINQITSINPEQISNDYNEKSIKYVDISSIEKFQIKKFDNYKLNERPSRAQRIVRKNDILVSTVRPYLKAFTKITTGDENLICSTGFTVIRVRLFSDLDLLFNYFKSYLFEKYFIRQMEGMAYPAITSTVVKEFVIYVSNNPIERKKIASILSRVDALIESTQNVIEKTERLKKGMMQKLLTRGIGHTKFKKVSWLFGKEIEIPEEWKIKKIGECCNILDSKRIPINSEERKKIQGTIPYYGANGIQGYVNDHIFDEELILLAEDGGYFEEYKTRPIAQYVVGKCWVNNHAHVLNAKNNNFLKLVFYSLIHKNITPYINGSTRTKLNQSDLRQISILIPSINEQQKIASILSGVDAYIQKTQEYKEKLDILKRGLMQKLLTGQIRV